MNEERERSPIVVTHKSGVKFIAQVRSHEIILDQTLHAGGEDTGPSPIEMLGVALGSCVALYVQQFCHARRLATDGLRVEVDQDGAKDPNRVKEFVVRVSLPSGLPRHYLELIERAARSCPAHNTLAHGASVTFSFAQAAARQLSASEAWE